MRWETLDKRLAGRPVAESVLTGGLKLRVKANLLYEAPLDNRLQLEVAPTHPARGQYAFQTDLAIFERRLGGIELPRVVFKVKRDISTHDVITYSAKALRHMRVYPYLRHGFLVYGREMNSGNFFTHNETLDFFAAVGGLQRDGLGISSGSSSRGRCERLGGWSGSCSRRLPAGSFAPRLLSAARPRCRPLSLRPPALPGAAEGRQVGKGWP
jgi:hypothetical protein